MAEQESAISELRINLNQYQELADLASDQAKAMEELHGVHLGAFFSLFFSSSRQIRPRPLRSFMAWT